MTESAPERELTWSDWLAAVGPHLPPELFAPPIERRLVALANGMPATSCAALEVRLSPGPAAVDIAVQVQTPAEARAYARRLADPSLAAFLARWADAPDRRLPFVWLELDLDRDGEPGFAPVFIPRLAQGVSHGWIVDELLPAISPGPPNVHQRGLLQRCLELAPAGAFPVYLFNLRGRGSAAVRLDFFAFPAAGMGEYFERLERPDLAQQVRAAVDLIADAERVQLNFDLDTEIQPRIGIEASYWGWAGSDPRWSAFLERLVAGGLCCPTKRDAVLRWSGYESARAMGERWPRSLPARKGDFLLRHLSHLKLVCTPGPRLEAKVYLLVGLFHKRAGEERLRPGLAPDDSADNPAIDPAS